MPFSCSFSTSCSSERRKSCIRKETSSGGRRQFSLEKAKSVRYSTPCSAQALTTSRTDSTPLRWPRHARQEALLRPAPVAVHDDGDVARHAARFGNDLRGTGEVGHRVEQWPFLESGLAASTPQTAISSFSLSATSLSMSAMDLSVSFCTSSCGALLLVLAHFAFLEQVLQVRDRVAADVAHRHLGVLAFVAARAWSAPCGAPR